MNLTLLLIEIVLDTGNEIKKRINFREKMEIIIYKIEFFCWKCHPSSADGTSKRKRMVADTRITRTHSNHV